tara:strand:- start:57 stop:254 length:198 start_codon:yes stop_codon:yes gene_type:complete
MTGVKMTKKIRKAIVFSLFYEIAGYLIVAENVWSADDRIVGMALISIPVFAYWARVFIRAGDSPK